ncbi:MAG: amidohydrolase family protein [Deltaproteobacteria bacterium]|nr:amidohydrolase family protein [Deltaproteobacteria bacterium]
MLLIGPDRAGRCVLVSEGKIAEVGEGLVGPEGTRRLSADGALIALGRVNAHTHLYSGLAPLGLPAPLPTPTSFVEILERVWWLLDRALDARTLRAAARLYVAEALLAGTTSIVDHHESPSFIEGSLDVLALAFDELGGRALLTYGATERNGGRVEAKRGLDECARFFWSREPGRVRGLVGLHAAFTVSDETLREAGELARSLETAVHVHVAEDLADVEDAKRRGYSGVLGRLLTHSALPAGSILAHGVHLGPDEVQRANDAGLWLVQNPRSNKYNQVGYPRALAKSALVALGTDGFPSAMDDEALALADEARAHEEPLEVVMRRTDAGRALIEAHLGLKLRLEPGADADLVVLAENGVRHTLVAGEIVVEHGQLATADLEAIREEAKSAAPTLFAQMRMLRGDPTS